MKKIAARLSLVLLSIFLLGGCTVFMDDIHTLEEPNASVPLDTRSIQSIVSSIVATDEVVPILKNGLTLGAISGSATIEDGVPVWHSMSLVFYKRHLSIDKDGGRISFATITIDLDDMRIRTIEKFTGTAKSSDSPVLAPLEAAEDQVQAFSVMAETLFETTGNGEFNFTLKNVGNEDGLYIIVDQERTVYDWVEGKWQ